jgi:hypothetical protein
MTHRVAPLLLAAALLAPRVASAAVTIEGFYGITRPPSADFSTAVTGARHDPDLIRDSLQIAGGDLILHLGTFELGAIADTSWKSGSASQTAIGGLVGIGGDLGGALRLELLGEAGGQRYGNFFENPRIVTASSSSEWFAYLGLRPGIAFRFSPGRPGVILGIWGFARWDLTTSNVPVTVGSVDNTTPGSVKLGGTTIGAVARLGFDF